METMLSNLHVEHDFKIFLAHSSLQNNKLCYHPTCTHFVTTKCVSICQVISLWIHQSQWMGPSGDAMNSLVH
jgi:hypothetical protein